MGITEKYDLMENHGSPLNHTPVPVPNTPGLPVSSSCPFQTETSTFRPHSALVIGPAHPQGGASWQPAHHRPLGLVSSGKALGGNREGVGSCGGQASSNPLTALAAMGLRLLLPLLLLWIQRTQGSELDPNGQHVCMDNR